MVFYGYDFLLGNVSCFSQLPTEIAIFENGKHPGAVHGFSGEHQSGIPHDKPNFCLVLWNHGFYDFPETVRNG